MILGFKSFFISLIVLIASGIGFLSCTAVNTSERPTFNLKYGKVIVKELFDVKFHTYIANNTASHIIETNNHLILQDTVQNYAHNMELRHYAESLEKPLNRIIISHGHIHHWAGLEMFPDVPVYANLETIREIEEWGDQMLKELRKRKGNNVIPYKKVIVPQNVIKPGEERIDGVLFRFIIPPQEFLRGMRYGKRVLFTELPEQKAIIHHHLAYIGLHFPPPPISARIEMLKQLKAESYNWIMAGHGIPLNSQFFDRTILYYETAQKLIEESPDVKTAKDKLMKAYPNYWGGLLDLLLPLHF